MIRIDIFDILMIYLSVLFLLKTIWCIIIYESEINLS